MNTCIFIKLVVHALLGQLMTFDWLISHKSGARTVRYQSTDVGPASSQCMAKLYKDNKVADSSNYGYCWFIDIRSLTIGNAAKSCSMKLGHLPVVNTAEKAAKLAAFIHGNVDSCFD